MLRKSLFVLSFLVILTPQGKAENVPFWVQNLSLKGDVRIRYQHDESKSGSLNNPANTIRDRARLRLRIGAMTRIENGWSAGFGLATGATKTVRTSSNAFSGLGSQVDVIDGEPRSTNFTFGDTLAKSPLLVDYAYIQYSPGPTIGLKIGKFANPIWQATDLLWDTDLNPAGITVPLAFRINPGFDIFVTPSYFILDEISAANDPGMFSEQVGCNAVLGNGINLKAAVAAYQSQFVKGGALDYSAGTNALINSKLANEYNAINPGIQVNFAGIMGYSLSVFADFVTNSSSSTNNTGNAVGISFGAAKVAAAGDWQLRALSMSIEQEAFLDIFPDSDAYGGATNCQGFEAIFTYGFGPNLSIGIDYYSMDRKTGATALTPKSLAQVDLVMKF